MNNTTDTIMNTKRWVCLHWNIFEDYYCVGPFANAQEAADWGEENEGAEICWQVKHLNTSVAFEVRAPGEMPELEPDPAEADQWAERQADVGDFYLLMICSDPLHLVGPFPDHRQAYSWAVAYEARTDDDGWQVVWLNDPAAPARLLTPAEGVEAARSNAEWRRQCRIAATEFDAPRL